MASLCHTLDECWDHDPDARLSAGCIRDRLRALRDATKNANDPNKWSAAAGAQLPHRVDDVITRLPHNIAPTRHAYAAPFSNLSSSSTYSGNSSGSCPMTLTSSSGGSDASSRYGGAFIGTFRLDEEALTCVRPLANVTATNVARAPGDDASSAVQAPRRS